MSCGCCVKVRGLCREAIAKHGKTTHGFFLFGFVLEYIPVLGQETVFESDNVRCNPGRGPSHPSEPAMRDDVVAFCNNDLVFIAQRIGRRPDQCKQSFASRRNMRTVLDVLRRPELFCRSVVTFVEESVESLANDRLVL